MNDRVMGFCVALEKDIRIDDAESTINAIRMVKGVISCEPIIDSGAMEVYCAKAQMSLELRKHVLDFFRKMDGKP